MDSRLSVSRLAQYRPFEHDGLDSRAALVDLVLATALEAEGKVPSLRECQDNCKTLWGLDLELEELREILDGLVAAGAMARTNGHFAVTPEKAAELGERVREFEQIEQQAYEDWEIALRVLNPGLTDEDVKQLRADLESWLERLIKRHGVESALILYPEVPRAHQLFAEIDREGIDFLPGRSGRVGELREQALYLFVRQPTEAQRTMLAARLNTAYFATVLSLDPSAAAIVQELTRGQRIYLDTNFVYRVLNLQGPLLHLSAKRLLKLTQELGYVTAVTPWTIRELKSSMERARDFLMKQPLPPAELAELAASATTDENFVTAYWIRLKEHPVSPKDFFEFYAQIEDHLAEHGIEVIDEGCAAVDRDDQGISEELSALERALGYYDKHEEVKLHDVKHRLLVRRLRNGPRRFSNAGYWFLTCDSVLPRYDQIAAESKNDLPFCATSSAWLQVMRSFTPRTEDFDQTIADLLTSPYIRYRGRIGYKIVEEVVARIDMYEGRTTELAAKVMLDTALMREIGKTPDEQKRLEMIDNAVVRAAAERERELEEAKGREAAEREQRRAAEAREKEMAEQLTADRARLEEERERLEREKADAELAAEERGRSLAQVEQQVADQGAEITQLQNALKRRSDQRRIALSAVIVIAALAGAIVPLVLGAVSGGWPVTLVIVGAVAVGCGALLLHVGPRRLWAAIVVVGVILGIVVAIHELASGSNNPGKTTPVKTP